MTVSPLSELLAEAHRRVRRLDPLESPFPAVLVRASDATRVLVDTPTLQERLTAVERHALEHGTGPNLLHVEDLVRLEEGVAVLLPWCVESLDAVLRRRRDGGVAVTAGEAVTLGASVIRGAVALREAVDEECRGQWWLTDDGRPVLVPGGGVGPAEEDSARMLREAADLVDDEGIARILRQAEDGVHRLAEAEHPARVLEPVEEALFLRAAPEPLVRVPFRARGTESSPPPTGIVAELRRSVGEEARPDGAEERPREERRRRRRAEPSRSGSPGWAEGIARRVAEQVDARLGARVGDALGAVAAVRRRPLVLALLFGGFVVGGGMLWPGDTGTEEPEPVPSPTARPDSDTPPVDAPESAVGSERADAGDPLAAAAELLDRYASCRAAGDTVCKTAVAGALDVADVAVLDLPASRRMLTLRDDLGAVALVRVDPVGGGEEDGEDGPPAQTLILVADPERGWLIKDIAASASS